MLGEFTVDNKLDAEGNPSGGSAHGIGIRIFWQDGPLGRHAEGCGADVPCAPDCTRRNPNGAFVETLIAIATSRLGFFQHAADGKFACEENAEAIEFLKMALNALDKRTRNRESRGVEGTHGK